MKVFKKQIMHVIFLAISLWLIAFLCNNYPSLLDGELWNISTKTWLYLAIVSPILHQVYVLVCWRLELYYNTLSNIFSDKGFLYYKIGFAILFLLRPITITFLAISNTDTLEINPILSYVLSVFLLIPVIYLFYSVKKYFGFDRAFGIDHFEPKKLKTFPMVNKGIFKYTSNGMYIFGFLTLWVIGFLFMSNAALLMALFSHIYIWIHYYYTERPDMDFIYGDSTN